PEQTIMVRRVPGFPGTLEELPISALEHHVRGYRYVHYAVVSGFGSFPEDMLRYDRAAPVNFKLVGRHELSGGVEAVRFSVAMGERLWIAKASSIYSPDWTYERWASFLWCCKHQHTERLEVR